MNCIISENTDQEKPQTDLREQLVNDGNTGPITAIAVSVPLITKLRGILFDLDPDLFRDEVAPEAVKQAPQLFFTTVVEPMLDRNPVLAKAEVRVSGRGLHVLLWFDEPVPLQTDNDRTRWAAIVQVVQAALPIDPNQPGITAVTRPLGSINGKTGTKVEQLRPGEKVTKDEVLAMYEAICRKPFETIMEILRGTSAEGPCPLCRVAGTQLKGLSNAGRCYKCGNVDLESLYNLFLAPLSEQEGGRK